MRELSIGDTTIPLCMGVSPAFYVDKVGPKGGVFVTPLYLDDIKTFSVKCEVTGFGDEVYNGIFPYPTVNPVRYRFVLKQVASPYKTFDSGPVYTSSFTFKANVEAFQDLVKYNGRFDVNCYAYDQFDNESSRLIEYIYLRKENDPFADSDFDGLDDHWEIETFGSIDFTNGSFDSNGSGFTDRQDYLSDKNAYEFSLNLSAGWNLISVPCRISTETVKLLKSKITNAFYYDGLSQFYKPFDFDVLLQESENSHVSGFWAFSMLNTTEPIKFSGISPLNDFDNFEKGWNLFGYQRPRLSPQSEQLGLTYSWINSEYKTIPSSDTLECLKGYWIKSH